MFGQKHRRCRGEEEERALLHKMIGDREGQSQVPQLPTQRDKPGWPGSRLLRSAASCMSRLVNLILGAAQAPIRLG